MEDVYLQHVVELLGTKKAKDFVLEVDGILHFRSRVCILAKSELRIMTLEKM